MVIALSTITGASVFIRLLAKHHVLYLVVMNTFNAFILCYSIGMIGMGAEAFYHPIQLTALGLACGDA